MDARKLAYLTLVEVVINRKSLKKQKYKKEVVKLKGKDLGFFNELVRGILKTYPLLKRLLRPYFPRKPKEDAYLLLSLGAYQLLFTNVPPYAAVNETVKVAKEVGKEFYAPFVNRVLRSVARDREKLVSEFQDLLNGSLSEILPKWMEEKISRLLGGDTENFLRHFIKTPPLVIRINHNKITRDEYAKMLEKAGISFEPTKFSPYGLRVERGNPEELPGYSEGLFIVQDEASQIAPMVLRPEKGERILDVGAFPGGKTVSLSGEGVEIWAIDPDKNRESMFDENMERMGVKGVKKLVLDFKKFKRSLVFHKGLLDAPCSSLGIASRQPDVIYTREEGDIESYRKEQIALLKHLVDMVKDGGEIVYSVCTATPEETLDVCRELESSRKLKRINISQEFPELSPFDLEGFILTRPIGEYYVDTQFVAKWVKAG